MTESRAQVLNLGDPENAKSVAIRTAKEVAAYGAFLAESESTAEQFTSLPVVDKGSYLTRNNFESLLGSDFLETVSLFRSSGSSGRSYYWPQLREECQRNKDQLRSFLEVSLGISEIRSAAVVGLALGSWIGGDHLSWMLKTVALNSNYPFLVFTPGSRHEELLEILPRLAPFVDQILLFMCPSAIGHLLLKAKECQQVLPLEKIRYVVLGESFPESLRESLSKASSSSTDSPVMLSIYGSADTGLLGYESSYSVALRRLVNLSPELRAALGVKAATPNFFHADLTNVYLEDIAGELCVTKWQGIPLVRYNLHDSVKLYSWRGIIEEVSLLSALSDEAVELRDFIVSAPAELPDIIAISGRSDATLILSGTNLTESMLDAAVRASSLQHLLTGTYSAAIAYNQGRQCLEFTLEIKSGLTVDQSLRDSIYRFLVCELGKVQPEFLDDWRNVYSAWDNEPELRIIQFKLESWPALSQALQVGIKHRGVKT